MLLLCSFYQRVVLIRPSTCCLLSVFWPSSLDEIFWCEYHWQLNYSMLRHFSSSVRSIRSWVFQEKNKDVCYWWNKGTCNFKSFFTECKLTYSGKHSFIQAEYSRFEPWPESLQAFSQDFKSGCPKCAIVGSAQMNKVTYEKQIKVFFKHHTLWGRTYKVATCIWPM